MLFSLDFRNGKLGDDGGVIPGAAAAIAGLKGVARVLIAAHEHGAGCIIEHPVSRRAGSPFAIPGRERHSTMWDTDVGKALTKVLGLVSIFGDQCPPPSNALHQKTTQWSVTKYWLVPASKDLNLKCNHPKNSHGTLRSPATATTVFATADTGVYTGGLCKVLVRVSLEGQKARVADLKSTLELSSVSCRRLVQNRLLPPVLLRLPAAEAPPLIPPHHPPSIGPSSMLRGPTH